jgi:hypothetical protein
MLATFVLSAVLPSAIFAADQSTGLSQAYSAAGSLNSGSGAEAVPVPVAAPVAAAPAAKKDTPKVWTIMVYVDGKNSLEQFIYTNLHQMEQVGSTDQINVVAEVGRMNGQDGDFTGDGNWTGCRRYLIQKTASPTDGISSPILQTIPDCDMGDYNHAIDFGKWAMSNFPAQHYMYILWDHGGGWIHTVPGFTTAKAIALDEDTHHLIDTPQMGAIMKALGHIDVYGSDACLMQMAEVDYEIRGYTDYVVGSEKTEPGTGWDYAGFLNNVNSSDLSAESVAKAAADSYAPQYSSEATISVVKSAAMDGFAAKLNTFTDAIENSSGGAKMAAAAREKARNFEDQGEFAENKDIYDFASLVSASSKDKAVKAAAKDLMSYIKGTLVVDNKVSSDYAKAYGLAIYAPTSGFDNDYSNMLFAFTKWPDFIKFMQQ